MGLNIFGHAVRRKCLLVLCSAAFAGSSVWAQQKTGKENIEFSIPVEVQSVETATINAAVENNIKPQIRQGDRFMKEGNYRAAHASYLRALKILDNGKFGKTAFIQNLRSQIDRKLVLSRKKWGESVLDQAKKIYLNALVMQNGEKAVPEFRKAKVQAWAALSPYYAGTDSAEQTRLDALIRREPAFNDNVQALVSDCSKMEEAYNFRKETSLESIDPDYKRRTEEISYLLRQAELHYRNRQFAKSRDAVEKVLVLDPFNQRAVRILNQVYKKLYQVGMMRAENDAMEQMAEVEWKWNEPIPMTEKGKEEITPREFSGKRSDLYEKLQKLIVEKVEYESIDVKSIFDNLQEQFKGVSFIFKSGKNGQPDPGSRKIQYLELEKTPLLDVIRYVCEISGLKFSVQETAVMIGAEDSDGMEVRFFSIRKSLEQRIAIEANPDVAAEKNDSNDKLKDAERFADKSLLESNKDNETKKEVQITSEMLKAYFTPMGIDFPEESTITYDRGSGKLIMKNFPKYQTRMENLLKEIDIPPPLVLVDSKVMEVSMAALEELGFDWMLTYTDKETSRQFQFSGLNSNKFYRSDSTNYMINGLKVIPNFGGDNQFNLSLSVRALDQKDRSEILATPRLLVSSGYQGKLTIAEERYFPDDYDDAEIEIVNGTSYTYTAPKPNFGDATNVGTLFTVKPTVLSNNYTIMLDIDTDLTRMTGWSNYDYSIIIGNMLYSPADNSSTNFQPKMKMPEFSKRKLKSSVKIYDGETVVIGGILEDIASRREDKWPLLGDIPLLGRLFTDREFATEKVNLMVFVTARLMNGKGLPVREARKQGLFEFNDR